MLISIMDLYLTFDFDEELVDLEQNFLFQVLNCGVPHGENHSVRFQIELAVGLDDEPYCS